MEIGSKNGVGRHLSDSARFELGHDAEFHIPKIRVAVVGAGGLAGLGCAGALAEAGMRVDRYEANGRLGGRVRTIIDPDGTIRETGGELINDDHSALISAAQELRLPLRKLYNEKQTASILAYHCGGKYYDKKILAEVLQPLAAQLTRDLNLIGQGHGAAVTAALDSMSIAQYCRKSGIPEWALRCIDAHVASELGRGADELAAPLFLDFHYERMTPENPERAITGYGKYTVEGGMSRMIDALDSRIEDPMQFGHRLTAIRKRGAGYELEFNVNGKKVVQEADMVVLCVPYSVLRDVDLSESGLPGTRLRAIRELPYGREGKIHIKSNDPAATVSTETMPDPATSVTLTDDFGGKPAFVWNEFRRENLPSLLRTIFSSDIASLREKYTDEELIALARKKLDEMYPSGSHNGDAYITDWTKDPFVRGSYATPKPGQMTQLADGFRPCDGNGIYFAGEHISKDYGGFMEGAFRTGQYAASALLGRVLLDREYWDRVMAERGFGTQPVLAA